MSFKEEIICTNCGERTKGDYCEHCGQKRLQEDWKKISHLIGNFFNNLVFLDNRVFKTFRKFFFDPGELSYAFLIGKHKRYLSPISIFLFANLIFFLNSPMRDYYLSLYDQISAQPYSEIAKEMVINRLENRGIEYQEYEVEYNLKTPQFSKLFMILNVPLMALFLFPFIRKRWNYYYDSLIISLHYFIFFLFMAILISELSDLIRIFDTQYATIAIIILLILGLFIYAYFTAKKLINKGFWRSMIIGIVLLASIPFSQFFYRFLIFLITFSGS